MPPKRENPRKREAAAAAEEDPLPKIFRDPTLLAASRLKHDLLRYGLTLPTSPTKPALVKAYKEQLGPYVGKKPDEVFSALNPSDAPKRKADAQPTSPKARGKKSRRSSDVACLPNPHLEKMSSDNLYHLGLTTETDLKLSFGDVAVVCFGGSRTRMEAFARAAAKEIGITFAAGMDLCDISTTDRYHMFKAGPVLSVSHGIGNPSASVVLHEVTKMLHYAEVDLSSVNFVRIGTSGGLGVAPGTVVFTTEAVNGMLEAEYRLSILGKPVTRATKLDASVTAELRACCPPGITNVSGKTMCCDDFYEGQGRLDGATCAYTQTERNAFLQKAHKAGVKNIEMESLVFSSFCHTLGIPAAIVCVALLDRFKDDQLVDDSALLKEYSSRSQQVVLAWLKHRFSKE